MRLGSRLVRSVLGVALFGALPFFGGCSAETSEPDDGGGQVSEEELRSEEESFTPLEATDAELTRAKEPERSFDHELTLFAIPAPKLVSLSWKSPGGLARRTLINEGFGFSRAIGHVFVRVDCGAIAGKPAASRQVGQTSTGDEFRTMVLKEKAGLGVLFRTVPGALETEAELDATLKDRYASGRIGYKQGPLHIAVGTARTNYLAGNQTQTTAGASYDFGVARLNALYGVNKKAGVENSAFHVGVAVPLGAFEVRAGYTDARVKGGDGARQIMGGVLYSLSKRTTLYVDASQVDNKGAGKTFGVSDGLKPVTAGGNSTGFEAGIRHTF